MTDFDQNIFATWVYLSKSPLTFLTLTVVSFLIAQNVYKRFNYHPALNPVLWSVVVIASLLLYTGTSYEQYFEGAQFVHFMLGPATVALAVPMYKQLNLIKKSAIPLAIGLILGSMTAIVGAVVIAMLLGASESTLLSLLSKSVTAAIAMGITEKVGGIPSLAAAIVALTGILGAVAGGILLNILRIKDPRARGVAYGTAAHGNGTARAMQESETAGAFSGLAMSLNALLTAVLVPLLVTLWMGG